MKIAVFAYNFPHKKTQDFLLRLFLENFKIEFVIAGNPIKLNLSNPTLRVKPNHIDLIHPRVICRKLGIPYKVLNHNSQEVANLLKKNSIDVGVIAGARILKDNIIRSVKKGIINFHPALLPMVRGLDALKWSIYYDIPLGVTAHFIDEKIDAGRIIKKEKIPIYLDDTFIDLSLRLEETQTNMLPKVLNLVKNKELKDFPLLSLKGKKHNPPMAPKDEREVEKKLDEYKKKYAKK